MMIFEAFQNCSTMIKKTLPDIAEPPDLANLVKNSTDDMIDSLVCPPPPSDNPLNEAAISSLIVPAPEWSEYFFLAICFLICLHISLSSLVRMQRG